MAANGHSTDESSLGNLESTLASFRASDQRREEFVQNLLRYVNELQTKTENLQNDYENELEARRYWQSKAKAHQMEFDRLSNSMSNGLFTLALIDGDGAIFQDSLLAAAADGGSNAAHQLTIEIKKHLQTVDPTASHLPLIVQMYTNIDGLSKKLYACGIIKTGQDLSGFVRAFNMSQPLFSIVDVGSGKERADHKLKESLRLYINNQQCKHIILGGISHDNGYIPNLNPYKRDLTAASHISLLETSPSEASYADLGFRSFKCPAVFRSEHLPNKPTTTLPPTILMPQQQQAFSPAVQSPHSKAVQQAVSALQASNLQPSTSTYQPRSATPPSSGTSPTPATRTPVNRNSSTSAGVPLTPESDPSSWATVGKSGLTQKNISIAPTPKRERPYAVLNKDEERLDHPIPKAKADFASLQERIKAHGKVCNYYHLIGKCPDPYCEYKHAPPISEGEKFALRMKARQKSCNNFGDCRDVLCINGHICPYGTHCNYDDECFFADTHSVDRNPVWRCYEDGSMEPFRTPMGS